ncbi:MAG: ROK family protein [Acidobacteriota bacterium]
MNTHRLYLGVDIGGTKCAVVLATGGGDLHERIELATEHGEDGRKNTVERLLNAAQQLAGDRKIEAVGISCGGPLDSERGVIICPPNLGGWEDTPIVEIFRTRLRLPIYLENDANAGALAEWRFGAGRGLDNLIFLTFGTGMGAGLILNGRLYRGTSGLAGEVGHLRLAEKGPVGFHKTGSFEGFCSGPGMAQMMAARLSAFSDESGSPIIRHRYKDPGAITGKDVVRWALDGDELALQVAAESGEHLGRGISILIDTLNPDLVIVGSMGVRLGDLLLEPARRVIHDEAIPSSARTCRVLPAALGERVGDFAALCVALEHHVQGESDGNWNSHG